MLRHVGTIHHASSGEGNHREKTCISRGKFEICVICEPSVNCCFTSVCLRSMCLSQIGRRCLKFIVVRSLNIVTVMIRNFQMFVEIKFELLLPILGNFTWKWFVCRIWKWLFSFDTITLKKLSRNTYSYCVRSTKTSVIIRPQFYVEKLGTRRIISI